MKNLHLTFCFILLLTFQNLQSFAFCGFYVAKADASLFNNRSEVILVRDGSHMVVTMSNDFKGDVRDFALVIPVPVVLKENDIRVVERTIFETLDAYSSPRLVEYYDSNPCYQYEMAQGLMDLSATKKNMVPTMTEENDNAKYGVKIEAQYSIAEYDILILSASESDGLKEWLIQNGYKIPPTAHDVLDPYIKNNLKFFVVKVNLEKMMAGGNDYLRPIQISFDSDKFILPIRLGMANSQGTQDMIVYAFTRQGRIECTNYRTVKMPTDRNIPLFMQSRFGEFYTSLFTRHWKSEGRNSVMLEYAWNVSPSMSGVKCDPCIGPPPIYNDFAQAGVTWASDWNSPGSVFFTRLHVRYSRDRFPADLQFQVTPNQENYQCRYIITHPANGPFDCEEAQEYLRDLKNRRILESDELYALTGKRYAETSHYVNEFAPYSADKTGDRNLIVPAAPGNGNDDGNSNDIDNNPSGNPFYPEYTDPLWNTSPPTNSSSPRIWLIIVLAAVVSSILIMIEKLSPRRTG